MLLSSGYPERVSATDKLPILVITPELPKRAHLETVIRRHVPGASNIYFAADFIEAEGKLRNAPVKMVITDFSVARGRFDQMVAYMKTQHELKKIPMMILDSPPEQEMLLEELVSGQAQFVTDWKDDRQLDQALVRALNYISHGKQSRFYLRYLARGDLLVREGDRAEFVYILKHGELSAWRERDGKKIPLGKVEPGEFVGEMAYINGEARTANVEALTECELVEIPLGSLDRLLHARPAWAKSLLYTLAKRLHEANERRSSE